MIRIKAQSSARGHIGIQLWFFGAHSLKNLERNILVFVGARACRHVLIGRIEQMSDAKRRGWLDALRAMGEAAR